MLRLPFKTNSVRDLAWVMACPSLIMDNAIYCRAKVVRDDWCDAVYKHNLPWLHELDQQPNPLCDWLNQHCSHRLGYYFEALVEFWLRHLKGIECVTARVGVSNSSRTLGEFDFLFMDEQRGRVIHWEVAVKFYLCYDTPDGRRLWLGPNSKDQLRFKLETLFNKQLVLSDNPEARRILEQRGMNRPLPEAFVKGYLFYPQRYKYQNESDEGRAISPHHRKGWWCYYGDMDFASNTHASRWLIVPRLQWLAPHWVLADNAIALLGSVAVKTAIAQHFKFKQESLLLSELRRDEQGNWLEYSRGFVVATQWPNEVSPVA